MITAIQVNHYLNKDDRIIVTQKCYNALKSNGIYITFENFAPLSIVGKEIGLDRWKLFQMNKGKSQEYARKHINRYGIDYFPITLLEHLNILKKITAA